MTLRQLWVRIRALPPDSPLWLEVRDAMKKAEDSSRVSAAEEALTRFGIEEG